MNNLTPIHVSLCMIVHNEEKWLSTCLTSVCDVVDEMVIVDTGSTDRTVEIANSFGAKVYHYTWDHHFANARNYSLQQASGEWIIWLDADEQLFSEDKSYLRSILNHSDKSFGRIELVNYYGEPPCEFARAHIMKQYRLFRNSIGVVFRGAIHEQLDVSSFILSKDTVVDLPVRVHHYGYLDETVKSKGKHQRNLELLLKEQAQGNEDPWLDYHIASEMYREERYEDAFERLNTAIKGFLTRKEPPPSLLYKMKYAILIALRSYAGAWPGINLAIQIYPDYVDLHFYKGIILLQLQQYEEALASFHTCLNHDNITNDAYLTMVGTSSFHAWYYTGICHEKLRNKQEAIAAYQKAIESYPNYTEAKLALDKLHNG